MDAHRDIGGEVPEEEWGTLLAWACVMARRQWARDGMRIEESEYQDVVMETFCDCWERYDPVRGFRFATYFQKSLALRLRGVTRAHARIARYDKIGAEGLYPHSRSFAWDDMPILWAQILRKLPKARHRAFLLRLLAGESAADIARDEGRTEGAMVYRLRLIARTVAEAKAPAPRASA